MVNGLLALLATVGALVATGSLVRRASKDRVLYLIAWSLTQVGLSLALICLALGFLVGFNALLFRVMEMGAALLGPMWLALGMIELIARPVQVRFGAWLLAISYSVVAMVILLVDPTKGTFTDDLPKPSRAYDVLPLFLVDGAHVIAVISLVACLVVTAMQASKRDREAGELLIPIALVALAGVLIVSGTRGFLPGPLAVIALGGAAGLVWYGALRTIPVDGAYQEDAYRDGDYEYGGDAYGDDAYGEEPATGYEEPYPEGHRQSRSERRAGKRGELRFPEPSVPEQRPAASTVNDDLRSMISEPPFPGGGGGLSSACGQITVYTLLDGREEAFDRQAAELVQATRTGEPDTLIFTCHEVVNAPTQRIFYQLFRDQSAFANHQRQPYLRRFLAESRTHVLATNVIELKLGSFKLPPAAMDPMSPSR